MKNLVKYTNLLTGISTSDWREAPGCAGDIWFVDLAIDPETGHYTRLTRFDPGSDTSSIGPVTHDYQEEVLILSGDLYDRSFDMTLVAGDYVCRDIDEKHGPFMSRTGCLVFEVAYPSKAPE